ncbi:MAG: hypothetical protein AVDCRST_MAG26-300 [uncultured Chloroflexia bacterium]|uniref:Potassium channel domain-containing protein n=1 Tax=uncultured Chloroflexia bacterium TaxID=1672391 RepID=A0A6J4HA25_9CHLR|nr:MAG: hypothetical protein AVDCRST_MAG26-300 [uncultured Chloroflexia bacterium]
MCPERASLDDKGNAVFVPSFIYVVAGVVLIGVVGCDIVATVLHPEVESPLSTRLQRLTWRMLMALDRIVPKRNGVQVVLNWGLPLMVAGLIALWLALLTVGFALVYYPWLGDPAVFAATNPIDRNFGTALYYSGVTLATLGYGDIQPLVEPFRVLAVAEALGGALTIAFGVAYVLAVYPALSQKRTVASALDAEVAGQADALPMVRRYVDKHGNVDDYLFPNLRELGLDLLAITQAHETHPVLYYAHSRRIQHSFLRILVTAQNLVGLLRYGLSTERHATIVFNPQLLLLEQSLHYSLRRLSASLHIPPIERPGRRAEEQGLAAEFAKLCDELERIGLVSARASVAVPVLLGSAISTDPGEDGEAPSTAMEEAFTYTGEPDLLDPALDLTSNDPVESYIVFRLETDPRIAAYAAASGYRIEDARADYPTSWWTGGNRAARTSSRRTK